MSRSSPPSTFITSITNVNRFRHRILSIPDGYRLFRTDIISSGRILFIPNGCRTSEASQANLAFHMHLYSSAVFPVLDKTGYQFTSILYIDFYSAKSHSYKPGLPPLSIRNYVASSLQTVSTTLYPTTRCLLQ